VRVAQAARNLGIRANVFSRWVREAASCEVSAFSRCRVMKAEDAELARPCRELARTKAERDLKKNYGLLCQQSALRFAFIAKHRGIWQM